MDKPNISVIGLGYVGLPVSIAFDEAGFNVVGFDIDPFRKKCLIEGLDDIGFCALSCAL